MAKKVKCPTCGAKNAPDLRRCRVCAALINLDVPEDRRGLALGPDELGGSPPTSSPPPAPDRQPQPMPTDVGTPSAAAPSGLDGSGIEFDVAPRNPDVPPPPPPLDEHERFDPAALEIDPPP